jgi:hypothetical protein
MSPPAPFIRTRETFGTLPNFKMLIRAASRDVTPEMISQSIRGPQTEDLGDRIWDSMEMNREELAACLSRIFPVSTKGVPFCDRLECESLEMANFIMRQFGGKCAFIEEWICKEDLKFSGERLMILTLINVNDGECYDTKVWDILTWFLL